MIRLHHDGLAGRCVRQRLGSCAWCLARGAEQQCRILREDTRILAWRVW